ncbi:Golgi integral membrane protein 4-like isoform X3 [Haliotis asinina]|uniref:Golgi integral membrane protein 4-like isoform X3 n=1 Tax=Haliotis asinina TaxID=109174 RepID=UPI00353231DD
MNKRGGPPVKLIVIVASLLGCVYLLYLYNSTQGRLREAEASAERYRRSDESKVAQLQVLSEQKSRVETSLKDSMKEKELLREKCENDRQEFVRRLNSLNSQHNMLKGQHEELEAENGRLQQDMQKARDDNANVEAQHRQEFSQMKQEKELEIASLRDQIANIQRQNDNLQNEISSLKAQLENSQKQLIVDQGTVRRLEQDIFNYKKQQRADQGMLRQLEKQLVAQKQNAAAAANAQNQQFQQQNIVQQQNVVQQQQNIAQQEQNLAQQQAAQQAVQQAAQQAVQQAAQINQPGGVQPNDLVYQAQGQGQFQGQGLGQGQGQDAVQNMNQNVNQDMNNLNMNVGAQVQNAAQDPNNQNQMAAGDMMQGQGQGQGQEIMNNEQHQMHAPNMDGANQEAANQNQNNKTAVGQHNPAEGRPTEKPLDDLKPIKDKAVEAKHNTLAPKSKLDSLFGDDAAIKTQKKGSFRDKLLGMKQNVDGDVVEGHADDVKVVDVFDNLKVDPGKPQEVKEKASGNNTDHIAPGHDEQAVEEKPRIDPHQEAIQQPAQGQDQVADVVMQAKAPQAPQNEGEVQKQDVHPDMMANQGQIFKPDFNNQVIGDNKPQVDQDNQLGINHDNRMQNEGPVNLQVQEPLLPNRNFDEDKHIPQQQLPPRNDADQAENEAPPLQPQGQGQMMVPNFGLGKNMGKVLMDGDVQVEGEEEEEEEDEEQYNDDNVDKYEMDDTADKDTLQEQMDV